MTIWREFFRDARWFVQQSNVLLILLLGLTVRLLWSYTLPLGNDEAYYWDWGRDPQLSYFDHPPLVGWISFLSKFMPGSLSARGLIPFIHMFTAIALGAILARFADDREKKREACTWLLLFVQLIPFFNFGGCLLVPDAGLGLSISLALYGCIAALPLRDDRLSLDQALWIGLWLGFAGLAKYHAAPLATGVLMALFWFRRRTAREDLLGWLLIFITGMAVVSPVLLWNLRHHFISFRFQAEHGFGGASGIKLTPALQTLLAQFILFTPGYILAWISWSQNVFMRSQRDPAAILSFWMAFPLVALLFVTSFFKQTLPHWIVPGLMVCIPAISIYLSTLSARLRNTLRVTVISLGSLVVIILNLLSTSDARHFLVHKILNERPGSLGTEFTIWETIGSYFRTEEGKSKLDWPNLPVKEGANCPKQPYIASLRWFWAGQMAYYLPGQPKVLNLDPRFLSYYHFRDRAQNIENCPIIIIGSRKHFDQNELQPYVSLYETYDLKISGHSDQSLFLSYGIGRKQPLLEIE